MGKKITITLTLAEAESLSLAIDNCLGDEQDNEAVFGSKNPTAAYRANEKLNRAIIDAKNPRRTMQPALSTKAWLESGGDR